MSGKTIFVIAVTALVTLILMKNTDTMEIWLFGPSHLPKLGVLGTMLVIGFVLGYLAGRPSKKNVVQITEQNEEDQLETYQPKRSQLSDEDRDYIS